eukprot:CAMPEP_0174834962 /NCGR_PEP_ID=MMETSP1114-20130205/5145_1 /TAXON_ID=312471 /ORGANISM="Neobodo designis, Strain CCAP 1951/1" /LENGTH=475 /DNA_ID=CAMNT_0016068893 /DNA_START=70 /DNA_END=1494 /DNA_ORIENTATION=+
MAAFVTSSLQDFIGCPCVACRYTLARDADISSLCETHRAVRSPPAHGCRFVAILRAPSIGANGATADEFVSLDVYGDHADMASGSHHVQSQPHLVEAIARTVDLASMRVWIGNVEDIPAQFVATTLSSIDDSSCASGHPKTARQIDDHRIGSLDSRTSSSSTAAQPASPPPQGTSDGNANCRDRSRGRAPVCPLDRRYWADVVFQPDARRPGAVLFSGRVFSYGAELVHVLAPSRLHLTPAALLAQQLRQCAGVQRFTYQHRPWAGLETPTRKVVAVVAKASAQPIASENASAVHPSSTSAPPAESRPVVANSELQRQTVGLIIKSGVAAGNFLSESSNGASPAPTVTVRRRDPLVSPLPSGPLGRFCARVAPLAAPDIRRRCYVNCRRVGAIPVPGDLVVIEADDSERDTAGPPTNASMASSSSSGGGGRSDATVATIVSLGTWSRSKVAGRSRLWTVLRLATIADVHASERVV